MIVIKFFVSQNVPPIFPPGFTDERGQLRLSQFYNELFLDYCKNFKVTLHPKTCIKTNKCLKLALVEVNEVNWNHSQIV